MLRALDRRGDLPDLGRDDPDARARLRILSPSVGRQVAEDRARRVLAEDHHPLDPAEGVADHVPQPPREAEQAEHARGSGSTGRPAPGPSAAAGSAGSARRIVPSAPSVVRSWRPNPSARLRPRHATAGLSGIIVTRPTGPRGDRVRSRLGAHPRSPMQSRHDRRPLLRDRPGQPPDAPRPPRRDVPRSRPSSTAAPGSTTTPTATGSAPCCAAAIPPAAAFTSRGPSPAWC